MGAPWIANTPRGRRTAATAAFIQALERSALGARFASLREVTGERNDAVERCADQEPLP